MTLVFTEDEVKEFARKVERLCEWLTAKATHSDDIDAVKRLSEDAADLQFADVDARTIAVEGIADVLR